jgi:hypothetical protein
MSTQVAFFAEDEIKESLFEPFQQAKWRAKGRDLIKSHDQQQWKLGEWVDEGVGALTEKEALKEAMHITGYAKPTLWRFAQTARVFSDSSDDPHSRRRDLSWSHHNEVAIAELPPEKRSELLDGATEGKWSIQELRPKVKDEVSKLRGELPDEKLERLQVLVSKATLKFLTREAKEKGIKRPEFAGELLDSYRKRRKRQRKA